MTLADHDTAHGDERRGADTIFLSAQHGRHDNVAARAKATIRTQSNLIPEVVQREHLMGFGKADLPWKARKLDRGLRGGARTADIACDQDDIGLRLRDTGSDRANARASNKLNADAGHRVDLFQVIDELSEVLDRIDVVVRWR